MFVIRMDADQDSLGEVVSVWHDCVWIDPVTGKPWYATNMAKPTLFKDRVDADIMVDHFEIEYPGHTFSVAIYEELFQAELLKELPKPPGPPPVVTAEPLNSEVSSWNWNDEVSGVPF